MGVGRALRARRAPIFWNFLEFSGWIFFPYNIAPRVARCAHPFYGFYGIFEFFLVIFFRYFSVVLIFFLYNTVRTT